LAELSQRIVALFSTFSPREGRESVLLSDRRHRDALLRARRSLGHFLTEAQTGTSFEFLAIDLREALQALGEITGETTPEEILDRIFSRFCIGK
jgi:tRNA modification GTPase